MSSFGTSSAMGLPRKLTHPTVCSLDCRRDLGTIHSPSIISSSGGRSKSSSSSSGFSSLTGRSLWFMRLNASGVALVIGTEIPTMPPGNFLVKAHSPVC